MCKVLGIVNLDFVYEHKGDENGFLALDDFSLPSLVDRKWFCYVVKFTKLDLTSIDATASENSDSFRWLFADT